MTNDALVEEILAKLGGKENVKGVQNCMTRLRFSVVAENKIDETGLKNLDGVLGLVHSRPNYYEVVVGPGKCRKCADICQAMGLAAVDDGLSAKAERTESAFYNSQKENVAKGNKNMGKELVWLKKAGTIQKGEAVLTIKTKAVPADEMHKLL